MGQLKKGLLRTIASTKDQSLRKRNRNRLEDWSAVNQIAINTNESKRLCQQVKTCRIIEKETLNIEENLKGTVLFQHDISSTQWDQN